MAVPGSIADLSTTASSNPPSGTDAVFPELDNHLRFIYSCEALLRDRGGGYLTSVSGVDSITATLTGLSSYQSGAMFAFSPAGTNTGAVTLNIGGLGAKSVTYRSAALPAGFLTSGVPVILAYDGTNFDVMAEPSPVDRGSAQTIGGAKTFTTAPASSVAASASTELVRKQELDAAVAGISIPDASTTVKGKIEIATNAEVQTGTSPSLAVVPAALAASVLAGATASWSDQTGSRALSGTYTNTSGRPIFIAVTMFATASVWACTLNVDSVLVGQFQQNNANGQYATLYAIVPNGSTYQMSGTGASIFKWSELS